MTKNFNVAAFYKFAFSEVFTEFAEACTYRQYKIRIKYFL